LRQKVGETPSQSMWWGTPGTPAMREVGKDHGPGILGKTLRPYPKNELRQKGLGAWLKW
jgi:hypothetical protein